MRRLRNSLVALVVVGLCAWGVAAQFDSGAAPEARYDDIRPIAIGDVLDVDFALLDIEDPPKPRNVSGERGRRATVLYSWSVACPCILEMEARMRALWSRWGEHDREVRWLALAGEPGESLAALRAKHEDMEAFYPVLRDPDQRVLRRLAIRHAGQVAILDAQGRLAYRGSVDADWQDGHAEHLAAALEAVLAGRAPEPAERPRVYGCEYALPLSCVSEGTAPEPER